MFKQTRLHKDILKSLQDNAAIGKYVLPVKFSQRIVFAEVDAADSNPRSIFLTLFTKLPTKLPEKKL